MSTTATSTAIPHSARSHSLLADYGVLVKPRVSTMVVITGAAGFYLGSLRSGISPFHIGLVEALFGLAVVTAGSSVLNQALERTTDRLMPRTADRPMAQRRIGLAHGLILGFLLVFGGSLYLAYATNLITGTLTLLTAVGYVGIYTPLKRMTTLNTFIGAFPGALPPLIGWMYRADYAAGGIRVTATQQPVRWAARSSVIQALFYAVLMIPVSLWPTFLHTTGLPYAIAATLLGLWYLYATIRFARILRDPEAPENRAAARNLLKVSVMYLPLLLAAMMLNAQGRLFF